MGLFSSDKFEPSKLKSHLKMAQTRIELLKNKKRNGIKLQQRQIAELLKQGKDESARIKVENVIREDFMIEAFEILELFCDLVQTRIQLISESRACPTDLKEAISSILYAAPRCDITELMVIRDQFAKKYGKEFVLAAMENRDFAVNQRVMIKLSVKVPEPYLCVHYLKDIADEHGIKLDDDMGNGGGSSTGGNMGGHGGIPDSSLGYLQPSLQMDHQAISSQQFHQPSLMSQPTPSPYGNLSPVHSTSSSLDGSTPVNTYHQQPPPSLNQLTHSGYNVDFTPGHMIVPPNNTLPRLDNHQQPMSGGMGGTGGAPASYDLSGTMGIDEPPAYDFDDLQKRFEALKRRE